MIESVPATILWFSRRKQSQPGVELVAQEWWPADDPERNLVVAGALIARELDRPRKQKAARMTHGREPMSVPYRRIESRRPAQTETGVGHECARRWFL
jgi:hypothetical protein